MKLFRHQRAQDSAARGADRRGAALLLSLLILIVLIAIVIQISVSTTTDARVARNDVGLTTMDQAVESALLQVYDQIATDGEAEGAGAPGAAGAGGAPGSEAVPAALGPAGGGQDQAQPTDSRRDEWARPLRTEINEIKLRIFVQDEDSKINVLNLLNPDDKEAQAAYERIVRCLDLCRDGTSADIDTRTAEDMTKAMREYMQRRKLAKQPRPTLLSDDDQNEDLGMPLSLREFAVLQPFEEHHFRDFRDEDDQIIHSIGAFLTVWSSLSTAGEKGKGSQKGGQNVAAGGASSGGAQGSASDGGTKAGGNGGTGAAATGAASGSSGGAVDGTTGGTSGGAGSGAGGGGAAGGPSAAAGGAGAAGAATASSGYAVNVNTAPPAVLKALFDDREVHPRLWDRVVEHRNLEEEKEPGAEEAEEEPQLDEYGEELIERRIFESLAEVIEIDGFRELDPPTQVLVNQLLTTQSQVFSIFVIARRTTSAEGDLPPELAGRPRRGEEDKQGNALVRVIRSVVWRHLVDEELTITPIARWEVLDYVPYEVLDYPEEER